MRGVYIVRRKRERERVLIECFGHDHAWQLKDTTREQTVCERQRCTSLSFEHATSNATMLPPSPSTLNWFLALPLLPSLLFSFDERVRFALLFSRLIGFTRYQRDARVSLYSHEFCSLSFLHFCCYVTLRYVLIKFSLYMLYSLLFLPSTYAFSLNSRSSHF